MKTLSTILLFFALLDLSAQCPGNMLANGSFTSQLGEAITAAGWISMSTPDVNDDNGILNTTPGYAWTGIPVASSDGGTWQNLFSESEVISQTLNVTPGQSYRLQFEYAAQGIQSSDFIFTDPVGVNIYLDDALLHTTPNDLTQFSWESYCYAFTPQTNQITLKFSASGVAYVAIDGMCLLPNSSNADILGNDTTLCLGETLVLDATTPDATAYLWQDNTTNPVYTVTQAGVYYVDITGSCTYTDTVRVDYTDCGNEPEPEPEPQPDLASELEMPNIFTPDNDGVNDFFHAKKLVNVNQARLQIVNRWGDVMYETDNLQVGWNGKAGGADCSEGTYFWTVNYTGSSNEQVELHGFVQLVR